MTCPEKLNVAESDVQYNWVLLDALGISYDEKSSTDADSGFPFLVVACVLVGALVLLASGLVIYNILRVAATKHICEYGTLLAIGSEKRQLYALVTSQLLILSGIGLPLGMLLGSIPAKGILTVAVAEPRLVYGRKYAGIECINCQQQHKRCIDVNNERSCSFDFCCACHISIRTICFQCLTDSCNNRIVCSDQTP